MNERKACTFLLAINDNLSDEMSSKRNIAVFGTVKARFALSLLVMFLMLQDLTYPLGAGNWESCIANRLVFPYWSQYSLRS